MNEKSETIQGTHTTNTKKLQPQVETEESFLAFFNRIREEHNLPLTPQRTILEANELQEFKEIKKKLDKYRTKPRNPNPSPEAQEVELFFNLSTIPVHASESQNMITFPESLSINKAEPPYPLSKQGNENEDNTYMERDPKRDCIIIDNTSKESKAIVPFLTGAIPKEKEKKQDQHLNKTSTNSPFLEEIFLTTKDPTKDPHAPTKNVKPITEFFSPVQKRKRKRKRGKRGGKKKKNPPPEEIEGTEKLPTTKTFNLSDYSPNPYKLKLLKKGLSFCPTNKADSFQLFERLTSFHQKPHSKEIFLYYGQQAKTQTRKWEIQE